MKLFRGRLGFPRWSFTDGLTKPRRVAERDPNELDEGSEETTQLPRFALTHTTVRGARSALTPSDRRLVVDPGGQRSLREGGLATGGIIQPVPSRKRADAPAPAERPSAERATRPTGRAPGTAPATAQPAPDTETHVPEPVARTQPTHRTGPLARTQTKPAKSETPEAETAAPETAAEGPAAPETTADTALARVETQPAPDSSAAPEATTEVRDLAPDEPHQTDKPSSEAPSAAQVEISDQADPTATPADADQPAPDAPDSGKPAKQTRTSRRPRPQTTKGHRPTRKGGSATKHLAGLDPEQVNFIEELREWMAGHGDWPVAPTDEAVDLASTGHPDRTDPRPEYAGLPKEPPAVVRAKNGRGFGGMLLNRRRRRKAKPRPPLELDRQRLDEVLTETRESVGDALVELTVFETRTGLLLAGDGGTVAATALWHRASHDLAETLRHADLPRLGGYYLVRLTGGRIAVVVNAHPDLGACLTLDLEQVYLGEVLKHTIPAVRRAVASVAVGASR